jgi:hypothetical protein
VRGKCGCKSGDDNADGQLSSIPAYKQTPPYSADKNQLPICTVHLPAEDGLNISPKHVKLRHYNAIKLFVLYVGYYTSNFIK